MAVTDVELPERFQKALEVITDEELEIRGITREQFRVRLQKRVLNDMQNSPKVGDEAPDFELELLSPQGARTGTYQKLSDYRGKPVGLIFGSYT